MEASSLYRSLLLVTLYICSCVGENGWDLRLIHGEHIYEGEVEVYLGAHGWFATCDPLWGMEEAIVVCRQLGYPGAVMAVPEFSRRSRIPLSRDWVCSGEEASLLQCSYQPTGLCLVTAGVICHEPGYLGCYVDTVGALTSALTETMLVEPTMTVDRCRDFCMNQHFRIVGLKNGNECYCGLSETELVNHERLSDAECQVPCPGNSKQVCGGARGERDELSVFDVNMGDCVDPGVPDNGRQLDASYRFGDIVRFECDAGYELIGVDGIQCILAPDSSPHDVIWSTSIPSCFLLPTTEAPTHSEKTTTRKMETTPKATTTMPTTMMSTTTMPTTTKKMTTTKMTTKPEVEPTQKRETTTERSTTRVEPTTKKITTTTETTTERKVPVTEKITERMTRRMTEEMESTMKPTTQKKMMESSTSRRETMEPSTNARITTKKMLETIRPKTTLGGEVMNDVTNYTDFIPVPTKMHDNETDHKPGNETVNGAMTSKWNFFDMLSEHSILLAIGGTFVILLVPIIFIVIFKKACKRGKKSRSVHIERSIDYQLSSETSGFTYEPQPAARPRYQSFRRGFKRFSKRPWSDREEDSSDEEIMESL